MGQGRLPLPALRRAHARHARVPGTVGHHGCDLAVFIRESSGIKVSAQRHEERPPYWHAVARVEVIIGDVPYSLISAHLAPSSPALRRIEAGAFALIAREGTVIAGGDWNVVPAHDPDRPLPAGHRPSAPGTSWTGRPPRRSRKRGLPTSPRTWPTLTLRSATPAGCPTGATASTPACPRQRSPGAGSSPRTSPSPATSPSWRPLPFPRDRRSPVASTDSAIARTSAR
jgi:hypothetical protein